MDTKEKIAKVLLKYDYPDASWERLKTTAGLTREEYMEKASAILPTTEADYTPKMEAKIVCLCGSTRFTDLMLVKQWELTKQGCIVLSWCALPDWYFSGEDKSHIGDQEGVKATVDTVHFRKIELSDEVFVINKDGYIGESTRNEINHALQIGKPIKYLEASK